MFPSVDSNKIKLIYFHLDSDLNMTMEFLKNNYKDFYHDPKLKMKQMQ